VNTVSAHSLGPDNRSSVLTGYRSETTNHSVVVVAIAIHTVIGEERSDESLTALLRVALDSAVSDLVAAASPSAVLERSHAWAVQAACYASAAVARVDGDRVTVARAGLAQVASVDAAPTVLLAPDVLNLAVRPPMLASALGAPALRPPSDVTAHARTTVLVVGGDVPSDPQLIPPGPVAAPDHPGRGGIVITLSSEVSVPR
jgi:hypothetical protein